jgi:hypothetical protein
MKGTTDSILVILTNSPQGIYPKYLNTIRRSVLQNAHSIYYQYALKLE